MTEIRRYISNPEEIAEFTRIVNNRKSPSEKIVDEYLEFLGKEQFKEFPQYCDFRLLCQKMDDYSSYYASLTDLRDKSRRLNDETSKCHFELEEVTWNQYRELRIKYQQILEERGLLEGFQNWLCSKDVENS